MNPTPAADMPDSPVETVNRTPAGMLWRSLVLILLAGATWLACTRVSEINQDPEAGVVMQLPGEVSELGFTGKDQDISEEEKTILPSDTEFARKSYTNAEGDTILASIVLSGGEKRSIHRPEICLPGQGWTIRSGKVIPIELKSGVVLQVMDLNVSREVAVGPNQFKTLHSHFLYWFVGKDRVTPSHLERTLATSWDRVAHKTNHRWAYVIVAAQVMNEIIPGRKDSEQTLDLLKQFIREIVPTFQKSEMTSEAPEVVIGSQET
jgi:EpsI family protein